MRILLAIDYSKYSKIAVNAIQQIEFPPGSELFVLHVQTNEEGASSSDNPSSLKPQPPDVPDTLRRLGKALESDRVTLHYLMAKGLPGNEILQTVKKRKIDLVVLGSRGLSRISSLLIGSVSEWVLADSSCSVLIGRRMPRKKKGAMGMNLLLAIDGSSDSWAAVNFLNSVDFPKGSRLTILHVVKKHAIQTEGILTGAGRSRAEFRKMAKELCGNRGKQGVELLEKAQQALAKPHLTIVERMALGHEVHEILDAAHDVKADMVVVGSRGLTGLRRFFLGSVSHGIVRHAHCSVLVVRGAPQKR